MFRKVGQDKWLRLRLAVPTIHAVGNNDCRSESIALMEVWRNDTVTVDWGLISALVPASKALELSTT